MADRHSQLRYMSGLRIKIGVETWLEQCRTTSDKKNFKNWLQYS